MKYSLILTGAIVLATATHTVHASQQDSFYIAPALEAKLVKVCEAVMSDSRLKLHLRLKEYRFDTTTINRGLKCNGESPYNFAMTHEAYKNADYLNRGQVKIQDIAQQRHTVSVTVGE